MKYLYDVLTIDYVMHARNVWKTVITSVNVHSKGLMAMDVTLHKLIMVVRMACICLPRARQSLFV